MENIVDFFLSISPIAGAFYATLFTWGLTALGASTVFFVKTMPLPWPAFESLW